MSAQEGIVGRARRLPLSLWQAERLPYKTIFARMLNRVAVVRDFL
jgi:hypothetical protein